MRFLFYATIAVAGSTLLFFAHHYFWRRWVRDTQLTGRTRKALTALIIALGLSVPLALAVGRLVGRSVSQPLTMVAFSWLGFAALAMLCLLGLDLLRLTTRVARRVTGATRGTEGEPAPGPLVRAPNPEPGVGAPNPEPEPRVEAPNTQPELPRRVFLARTVAGASAAGAAGLFVIGTRNALGEVDVVRFPVALPRLPRTLDGFRIVQISDVHIGALLDGRFLDGVVEKINAEKPDLVVITGDLVDGSPRLIGADVGRLGRIVSRHGTYFITGNHEYYSGAGEWIDFLDGLQIRTLLNQNVRIGDRSGGFTLAGITDKQGSMFLPAHTPDLQRALEGRPPDDAVVLLAHRPNPIVEASAMGVGLQLSGHTHGGQFFPITAIGELVHPYNAGLHQHSATTQIYVSRGTGFWGPPLRLLAPAEITSITLTAA